MLTKNGQFIPGGNGESNALLYRQAPDSHIRTDLHRTLGDHYIRIAIRHGTATPVGRIFPCPTYRAGPAIVKLKRICITCSSVNQAPVLVTDPGRRNVIQLKAGRGGAAVICICGYVDKSIT